MAIFEIRHVSGKGKGLIATQRISQGSVILTNTPMLSINGDSTDQDIEVAFQCLSTQDKDTYLSLSKGRPNALARSSIVQIFLSNAFDWDQNTKVILPAISRINHSCVPNAQVLDGGVVRAQHDISPGEEIQICYNEELTEVLTASQRNVYLTYRYGFKCQCKICLPTEHRRLSDHRRLLIGAVRFALEGQQPDSLRQMVAVMQADPFSNAMLHRAHWPPRAPPVQLTRNPMQKIVYTYLLAKLREAEGLHSIRLAETFNKAANLLCDLQRKYAKHLLAQYRPVLFVEAFRCHEAWMNKAIHHSELLEGQNGVITRIYKEHLQNYTRTPS